MKKVLLIVLVLFVGIVIYLAIFGYGECAGWTGKECLQGFRCKTSPIVMDAPGKCILNPFIE